MAVISVIQTHQFLMTGKIRLMQLVGKQMVPELTVNWMISGSYFECLRNKITRNGKTKLVYTKKNKMELLLKSIQTNTAATAHL